MARNDSLASMVMFLCFGTAILFLAVHWRNQTTGELNQSVAVSGQNNPNYANGSDVSGVYRPTASGIGEVALGASPLAEGKNSPKTQGNGKRKETAKKTRLVVTKAAPNPRDNDWPKPRLAVNVAQPKTGIAKDSNKTQVFVDLSDRRVYVYHNEQVMASYPIAIGKEGWETPTGNFQVVHKEHDPIWRHPITGKVFEAGTDSPLGDRWVGFWSDGRNEIGFHGTPNNDLVGEAVSHGCLRMRNSDVRMLYDQVSLGTPVIVRE
jgi:lipoprotein-anchoring transpeptidase ErfK/SrfK